LLIAITEKLKNFAKQKDKKMKITKSMLKNIIQEELGALYELDPDPGAQTHPDSGPGMTHAPDPIHMDFGDEPESEDVVEISVQEAVGELMAIKAAHPVLKALATGMRELGL
jgi:hypothetical protein